MYKSYMCSYNFKRVEPSAMPCPPIDMNLLDVMAQSQLALIED